MSADPSILANTLIANFARAAFLGNGAWFLGAGVSRPSGSPDWSSLLRPFARPIGIEIQDAGEDLPAIAQYIINHYSGNRGPLVRAVLDRLTAVTEPSAYHLAVARSSVGLVWTTNYDLLMERALSGLRHAVRSREDQMTSWDDPGATIELIKAHGSADSSPLEEIVIATQDYEDYALNRPATLQRLQGDLLSKSFLFVGYGYGDPNIRTALVEARRLARRATLPHYMLQTRVDPSLGPETARRQDLWCADLRRMGVDCLLTADHAATQQIVEQIAIQSRGPTIYVTGSHEYVDPIAAETGKRLADAVKAAPILLDGQSTGTGRELLRAFQAACIEAKHDVRNRIRFFPNPYAANPAFANDVGLLPLLKQWRAALIRQAHTVIVFDGRMGTEAEVEIARDLGCRIIPAPRKDGPIAELLTDATIAQDLEHYSPGYIAKAKKYTLTSSDLVECALSGLPIWT